MITNKTTIVTVLIMILGIASILLTHTPKSIQSGAYSPIAPLPTQLPTNEAKVLSERVVPTPTAQPKAKQSGMASFYTVASSSNLTASGQEYIESKLTVAHKTLPFGTQVRITNLDKDKSVIATVNDRGPYIEGRIVDLSPATNQAINCNLCRVSLEVL